MSVQNSAHAPADPVLAGRIVAPHVRGVTPIRRNVRKGTLVVYLHNVFRTNPGLRPAAATIRVSISRAAATSLWST